MPSKGIKRGRDDSPHPPYLPTTARQRNETPTVGRAFGDFTIADVFESVVYWLPADRNTLDALSHACAATRRHLAHSPNFVDAVFVCSHECHVRCYMPRKRLAVQRVKFVALRRFRACIHDLLELRFATVRSPTVS